MRRGASPDSCPRLDEVASILESLLAGVGVYFDRRLVLNSDGRRALARAAKACDDQSLKKAILEVLRDPTLERVERLYEEVAGADPRALVERAIEAWGRSRRGSAGP